MKIRDAEKLIAAKIENRKIHGAAALSELLELCDDAAIPDMFEPTVDWIVVNDKDPYIDPVYGSDFKLTPDVSDPSDVYEDLSYIDTVRALVNLAKGARLAFESRLDKHIRDHLNDVLQDDDSETGGVAYEGETLYDFLIASGISTYANYETVTLERINENLKACGIRPVTDKPEPSDKDDMSLMHCLQL